MSTSTVQNLIDSANRKAKASNRQAFARRATDQKHHENLSKHVDVVLSIYHDDVKAGLRVGNNLRAAVRELKTAQALSKRNLQL